MMYDHNKEIQVQLVFNGILFSIFIKIKYIC